MQGKHLSPYKKIPPSHTFQFRLPKANDLPSNDTEQGVKYLPPWSDKESPLYFLLEQAQQGFVLARGRGMHSKAQADHRQSLLSQSLTLFLLLVVYVN